jgi:hypothetical protein
MGRMPEDTLKNAAAVGMRQYPGRGELSWSSRGPLEREALLWAQMGARRV